MKKILNKKGFTLIELIIVIAILGILAFLAVPRLFGFTDYAKQANDEEIVAIVANAAILSEAKDSTFDVGTLVKSKAAIKKFQTDGLVAEDYSGDDIFQSNLYKDAILIIVEASSPNTFKVCINAKEKTDCTGNLYEIVK